MTAQFGDLDQLRFVERAEVFKKGELAAALTRSPDGVRFAYEPGWVAGGGVPIASTLPVDSETLIRPGGALPAYFAGLLPEGRRLGALKRQTKTSADDELTLLLAVGADVIGDVQVIPEGGSTTEVAPRLQVEDFSTISFASLLSELGIRAERVGLPGVQDKVSAAMLSMPVRERGARFILKLNPPEYPHVVTNEAILLDCAREAGIETVSARIVLDREGERGLLVRRFDRVSSGSASGPRSLAVEDACQAAGLPPADKYRISSENAFLSLTGMCQAPLPAARTFLKQLVFAYLSGNGDAHAKNFSVLQDAEGEWRPSPAYDIPTTYPYGDDSMAMTISSRASGDYGAGDFVALGEALGLRERAVRRVLADQVDRVDVWLPGLSQLPFEARVRHKLARLVTYRRDRLLQ